MSLKHIVLSIGLITCLFFCSLTRAGAFFETGSSDVDVGVWLTVTTQKTYTDPVVIAGPITHNNDNSLSVRIRSASGNSFQMQVQSPCTSLNEFNSNSPPPANTCPSSAWQTETVQWLVVERGTWVIPNGTGFTKIEAYLHSTNTVRGGGTNGDVINFSHTYATAPAVLHTINTFNDPEWITTTVFAPVGDKENPPTTTGFRIALEGAEAVNSHPTETIGWVAIERGSGTYNGNNFAAGRTGGRDVDRHQDECQNIAYGNTFTGAPNVVVKHNSMDGGNGGWVRLCGSGVEATQFNVHIDEDQVNDTERTGIPEFVAWFAFQANSVGALEFITASKSFTDASGDNQVGPGELVTFNVVLTNLQNDFAQANNAGNEFVDTLDSNFVFDSIINDGGGGLTNSGQDMLWNGSIPASGTVNLSYRVRVADSSTVCTSTNISNQAQVNMDPIDNAIQTGDTENVNSIVELSDDTSTDDTVDSDLDGLTNDDDPTLVPVNCRSNVSVVKTDGAGSTTYTPGQDTEYTITITNDGPHNLIGAVINDVLPANASNNGDWTCDPAESPGDGSASCVSGSAAGTTQAGTGNVTLTVDIPNGKSLVIKVPISYSESP